MTTYERFCELERLAIDGLATHDEGSVEWQHAARLDEACQYARFVDGVMGAKQARQIDGLRRLIVDCLSLNPTIRGSASDVLRWARVVRRMRAAAIDDGGAS